MKRILAIIISVAMIATMLAVSVSAEKEVGGDNGVTTFEPTTPTGEDLNVKVTEITHKYAVDLVYSLQDLVIDGAITWNVNTMKYEVGGRAECQASATPKISAGESHPRHFRGLLLISSTTFLRLSSLSS